MEVHRAGGLRHATRRLEGDGERVEGATVGERGQPEQRPSRGVDGEDARGHRLRAGQRPELVGVPRRRRGQAARQEQPLPRPRVPE